MLMPKQTIFVVFFFFYIVFVVNIIRAAILSAQFLYFTLFISHLTGIDEHCFAKFVYPSFYAVITRIKIISSLCSSKNLRLRLRFLKPFAQFSGKTRCTRAKTFYLNICHHFFLEVVSISNCWFFCISLICCCAMSCNCCCCPNKFCSCFRLSDKLSSNLSFSLI